HTYVRRFILILSCYFFFFSSRRRHTRSVSAFLLNRSSDLNQNVKIRGLMVTVCPSQFATRRTLFHVLVGCGLLMLKVSRLKLPRSEERRVGNDGRCRQPHVRDESNGLRHVERLWDDPKVAS